MKIMHLLPSLTSGGVEQVVLELCQGMQEHGIESVVVSAGGAMVEAIEQTGARHVTLPVGSKRPIVLLQIFKLASLIRREKPNILHVHSRIPAWVCAFALKLLRKASRPVVLSTFHGFYSVSFYSAIMTKAERIIAVSDFTRDHILERYPETPAEKICVIKNTIDPTRENPQFRPGDEWLAAWRSERPELAGKYVLCLPSRITRWKGAEHLVPILSGLIARGIPAHVIIPGEAKKGKEAFEQELIDKFSQAGLSDHVSWLGLRRDMREIFYVSDVILSLSLKPETFGKVSLEALALNRPVAGYDHGGIGEQLREYLPEGCIPVGDAEAMVERLAEWYKSPPKLQKCVGSPYLRQDMINAHLSLYREWA